MEKLSKGELVLYSFPFTDLTCSKIRPCLVLSNELGQDILLCQITSRSVRSNLFSEELSTTDLVKGSIVCDSLIRCEMVFTAQKSKIVRKIGLVSKVKYLEVIKKIVKIIS